MPCSLPPEILDLIIGDLHDEPTALKLCCLVSKSWVPRTRRHLFAHVEFGASGSQLKLWNETFPNPPDSPAHHTRTLSVCNIPAVTPADAGMGGWIRTFYNVVHLRLSWISDLFPFYGLSPVVRSLHLTYARLEVFDHICSFPLLEDLALVALLPGDKNEWNAPLTSPKLTGHLELGSPGMIHSATRRLLALPGGPQFSKIDVVFSDEGVQSATDLISGCSETLKSLTMVSYCWSGFRFQLLGPTGNSPPLAGVEPSGTPSLDLSKATKLEHLKFRGECLSVQWIATTLQTIHSKNVQSITIYPRPDRAIGEAVRREWKNLDRMLVRFWTSHSIRPQVMYVAGIGGDDLRDCIPSLLPELTMRGLIDLVEAI